MTGGAIFPIAKFISSCRKLNFFECRPYSIRMKRNLDMSIFFHFFTYILSSSSSFCFYCQISVDKIKQHTVPCQSIHTILFPLYQNQIYAYFLTPTRSFCFCKNVGTKIPKLKIRFSRGALLQEHILLCDISTYVCKVLWYVCMYEFYQAYGLWMAAIWTNDRENSRFLSRDKMVENRRLFYIALYELLTRRGSLKFLLLKMLRCRPTTRHVMVHV